MHKQFKILGYSVDLALNYYDDYFHKKVPFGLLIVRLAKYKVIVSYPNL